MYRRDFHCRIFRSLVETQPIFIPGPQQQLPIQRVGIYRLHRHSAILGRHGRTSGIPRYRSIISHPA